MSDKWLFIGVGVGLVLWVLVSLVEFGLFVYKATHPDVLPEGEVTVQLPQKCRTFYGDGTEAWKDCMGVGYVHEEDEDHD